MTASFTVYIDESGDEGFVFHPSERGSSRLRELLGRVLYCNTRKSGPLKPFQSNPA